MQTVNILLVDDQPANLHTLEAILEPLGRNLVRATSGESALRHLLETDFAVVLMDVQMPSLNGFEVARLVRARGRTRHTPIIFLTAAESPEFSVREAYALGAVDYLVKPLAPEIVRAKVAGLVELFLMAGQIKEQADQLRLLERREFERQLAGEKHQWELERLRAEAENEKHMAAERGDLLARERHARAEAEQSADAVRQRTAQLEILSQANQRINAVLDVPVILRTLVNAAMRLVNATAGTAGRFVDGEMVFDEINEQGKVRPNRVALGPGHGVAGWVMTYKTPYLCDAVGDDPHAAGGLRQDLAAETLVNVPILGREDELLGCVELYNKSGSVPFTQDDVIMLQGLSAGAATALENARLLHQVWEADRRKDEFLAMLAHELRNPLAPALNGVHILRKVGTAEPAGAHALDMMERQLRHLSRLVDDLLDVSRITRGKVLLRKGRLDLARLVRSAIEDRRGVVEKAGLQLSQETPSTPVWVTGDATRLAQVFSNLLDNAVKFTDARGTIAVRLITDDSAKRACVCVTDTGAGIEPAVLPKLFDVFAQSQQSLDRSRGGLGLGLSVVRGLVELHGGDVRAASEGPGKGASFTVSLPVEPEPAALADAPEAPAPAAQALRVVVVEDNRDAADSLRILLQLQGHEVAVAHNGPDGVEVALAEQPDVVVCDIGLPGFDGYEVARRLRREPEFQRTLFVALTGYGQDEDRRRSEAAGFDQHLTKPADPVELQCLLAERA